MVSDSIYHLFLLNVFSQIRLVSFLPLNFVETWTQVLKELSWMPIFPKDLSHGLFLSESNLLRLLWWMAWKDHASVFGSLMEKEGSRSKTRTSSRTYVTRDWFLLLMLTIKVFRQLREYPNILIVFKFLGSSHLSIFPHETDILRIRMAVSME